MLENLEKLINIVDNNEKPSKVNNYKPPKYRIDIDEDKIDLFKQFDLSLIPEWKPSKTIKPFSEVKTIHLDIETDLEIGKFPDDYKDGMWNYHPIVMIGLMRENGKHVIIHDENEAVMLQQLFYILHEQKPEILTTFNGFDFDLPYIIGRANILGIKHPFMVDTKNTCHTVAQRFAGQPSIYKAIRLTNSDGSHCAIIDLYHQLLAWDFVARKLNKFTLKAAPLQLGLRKESRLDLGGEGIKNCIDSDDWGTLREYLVFDLEDTKDLGEFLLPSIYYQKLFLDWNLQSIATGGNGSKHNDILMKLYGYSRNDVNAPQPEEQHRFSGGFTDAFGGLYENTMKCDVASLYPHIMLHYGIYEKNKDPEMKILQVLKYLLFERLRLKKLAKSGDKQANQAQGALKVLINSMYGILGCQGINFNSYKCAAMVTAIGRAIAKQMVRSVVEIPSVRIATVDTDGVAFENKSEFTNDELWEHMQSELPHGINIEYEWYCEKFFVPFNKNKKSECTGLKKNYIMLNRHEEKFNKETGKKEWVVTKEMAVKGQFANRARCLLDKTFQPLYLLKQHKEGTKAADEYYYKIRKDILTGKLDYNQIRITRRIGEHEKTLPVDLNKPVNSIVSYYRTDDKPRFHKTTGKLLQTGEIKFTETEPYNRQYYVDSLDEMYQDLKRKFEEKLFSEIEQE